MNSKIAAGTALSLSPSVLSTTAFLIGVAKTGTAIGSLSGAAHTSATAAWIGLGSMKAGMFMMGAFPIVGALLILDGISGRDYGAPLIDWEEEFWRNYEVQCELEEMKKNIQTDDTPQVQARKVAGSLAQLENQFLALEVDHELYLLKKELGLI